MIQFLDDENAPYELADAEWSYKQALALDPQCIEALEELGHFYDAVMADPVRARPFFRSAARLRGDVEGPAPPNDQ
ncbi:MAG: hypothetical protein AAF624_00470 [Bacteroidota bacterium]